MEAIEWFKTVVTKHYADFNGRAARPEFWYFVLVSTCISIVLVVIDDGILGIELLSRLFGLAMLLPNIGVAVRRLHDIDKSGWWFLLVFIPVLGWIVLIYWYAQPGTNGSNRFGAAPNGAVAEVFS